MEIPFDALPPSQDKLKNEGLVNVAARSTFLRYNRKHGSLQELSAISLFGMLHADKALKPQDIM